MPAIAADVSHIRPLVDSLCEQRKLPVLVTDLIARYLDRHDLLAISILSPALHTQASTVIYKDVVLDLTEDHARRRAALLLRTLLTTPTAASNVQSLSLTGQSLDQWRKETAGPGESVEQPIRGLTPPEILVDLTSFAPKELYLYRKTGSLQLTTPPTDWRISLPRLCLDIISLLHHRLEDMHINSDYFRYPDFRDKLANMFDSGGFRNMQNCILCMDVIHPFDFPNGRPNINAVRDWDDTLLAPFFAPNITSITGVMTLSPEAVSRMPASSITRLTLHHCQIQDFDLDGLLAATPRLCYLEYHASVDHNWYSKHWSPSGMSRSLGLDPLFNALHHVRNTLTELVTSQKFREDSHHFEWGWVAGRDPPFRQFYELCELKHLHTLVIPYASLLGWKAKEPHTFDWHKILPASLHHVTFTDDLSENFGVDGWEDQSLIPVFLDLASRLSTCTRGGLPPKFTLRLLQTDTDFHKAEREKLCRMFHERGVLCAVEKHLRDWAENRPRHLARGGGGRRFAGRPRLRGRGRG